MNSKYSIDNSSSSIKCYCSSGLWKSVDFSLIERETFNEAKRNFKNDWRNAIAAMPMSFGNALWQMDTDEFSSNWHPVSVCVPFFLSFFHVSVCVFFFVLTRRTNEKRNTPIRMERAYCKIIAFATHSFKVTIGEWSFFFVSFSCSITSQNKSW